MEVHDLPPPTRLQRRSAQGRATTSILALAMLLVCVVTLSGLAGRGSPAFAQLRTGDGTRLPAPVTPRRQREVVHADVSTRSVQVTSSFTGTEIIVFGSIEHGRPENAANEDLYDIVVLLEGVSQELVVRRKSKEFGIWVNTQSLTFDSVPSYYAISTSRPLQEIADTIVLRNNDIGFEQVRMTPTSGWQTGITTSDLRAFSEAVIRLKTRQGLYVYNEYGVEFVGGASLFRTTIDLPANVPVGPLKARVLLFRKGQMLSKFESTVQMQRGGLEWFLHAFAFDYPMLYGIAAVLAAAGAGLAASSYFSRRRA